MWTAVSDVLIPMLGPLDMCKLRRVNRCMAMVFTKQAIKKAMVKFEHLVVLSDDTVRVHSRSGRTVIELILQSGYDVKHILRMRFEGRLYRGWADQVEVKINGAWVNLTSLVFHKRSPRLFNAGAVYVEEIERHGLNRIQIDLRVLKDPEYDYTFALQFVLDV